MPIVNKETSPVYTFGESRVYALASPGLGAREVTVFRSILVPGESTSAHYHDHEELLTVLAGTGTVRIAEHDYGLESGDTAIIPAGDVHTASADIGDAPWEILLAAPVGLRYFSPDGKPLAPPPWSAEPDAPVSPDDDPAARPSEWTGAFY